MKIVHRLILRALPGPFIGWLSALMFLLLMQFLIRYLPDIVGKGLPIPVIVELVSYNLAYMVVLAVPMSVLIASLMAYGRLAETRAYAVLKSAGASVPQLLWPAALVAGLLSGGMWYFNNEVLPEANFRAKVLWDDIRRKKPGFQLQQGVFYSGLNGYSILINRIPPLSDDLYDILVYDYTVSADNPVIIKASRGRIEPAPGDVLHLVLTQGEMHREIEVSGYGNDARYERLAFDRYRVTLDLSGFSFERSRPTEGYRSDRTMRTVEMVQIVDSLRENIATMEEDLRTTLALRNTLNPSPLTLPAVREGRGPIVQTGILAGLDSTTAQAVLSLAVQRVEAAKTRIDELKRTAEWDRQRADRYAVEVHKKTSIAVACLIFMLIGAPLGLSIRRGGLGTAGALAIGIFLFYWVTLVQGEKMADRGYLPPWFGMWIANIVMSAAALWLLLYQTLDLGTTTRLFSRFRRRTAPPDSVVITTTR